MFAKLYDTVTFMKPEEAVAEIEARLARGEPLEDGDYDEAASALVERKWPSVVDWKCEYINSLTPGTVTLNGLTIVSPQECR